MHNPINIDHKCSQAIGQEIGERLRVHLGPEPELPANLRKQLDLLYELEGPSPPLVPDAEHGSENKPDGDVGEPDRSRFTWPWRRKG